MVNILRYKIYKETVENAIRRYSEDHWCAGWYSGVEEDVYNLMKTNDPYFMKYFTTIERSHMQDLDREGMWVVWKNGEVLLTKSHSSTEYMDYDNCVNGAD